MRRTSGWAVTVLLTATLAATPTVTTGRPASASTPSPVYQLVVKVSPADGCSIDTLAATYELAVDDSILASRRVYRAHSTDPKYQGSLSDVGRLTDHMSSDRCVVYAEPDAPIALADDQFHSWTPGDPQEATEAEWQTQSARSVLQLETAHEAATGRQIVVAVLDTGVDAQQPALAEVLLPGHDYVADDDTPEDAAGAVDSNADGEPDSAVGHGTFVSGMVSMVAPDARIMPMKVLDADGNGSVFPVAEAVYDAIASGVTVINMSFGTADETDSKVLEHAFEAAVKSGVAIVAAAGNDANREPHYPAANHAVWAVAATNPAESRLATYSNQGRWVDVATVGTDLVGPLPQGRFGRWSGTSLAAPVFAGQLALLWSMDPGRDQKKVKHAVTKTCRALTKIEMKNGVVDLVASLDYLSED